MTALAQPPNVAWQPGPGFVHQADKAVGNIYIVHHQAPPLALYTGGFPDLPATAAFVLGERKLNLRSPASLAYLAFLEIEHSKLINAAESTLGRELEVLHRLSLASSGFTARMTPQEAEAIAQLDGVRRVSADVPLTLHTDNGPAWIGAEAIYDGSGTVDGVGSFGEGVIVGVIDSGVNFDHPSFAATGPVDGYVHENPHLDAITGLPTYVGLCDPVTGAPFCNNKLIGVWDYTGTTPHDDNNHGSHTASTAAGNILDATLHAPTIDLDRRISGVAPHANIITYKGCVTTPAAGNCAPSSLLPVADQAIQDGVDVINYSIGGSSSDPWTDDGAQAFLAAQAAGIFVATSAGNDGPKAATLGSPGDAPWILTVAASTHDRALGNALIGMSGGTTAAPADINGKSLTSELPTAPIVYAGDFGDALCGTPFPAGTFNGEIVVCDRGTFGRVEKSDNVAAGGAGGYVLANDVGNGNSLVGDAYPIPGVHISYDDGVILKAWLADGGSGHQGAIAGTTPVSAPANGDIMASFSSRGPNPAMADLVKPDITAPGADILAAYATDLSNPTADPEIGVLSGTSMSSPHAAGAGALLVALHPDWSPDQIRSALMTTAYSQLGRNGGDAGLLKEDGSTPADAFDLGAGRVNLILAAKAGLTMDESADDYTAANPANGGIPRELNLPSLGNGNCISSCSWTRTVTGVRDTSWTVSASSPDGIALSVTPSSFSLSAGATQALNITADVAGLNTNEWSFGRVILTPSDPSIPTAQLPVAVRTGPVPRSLSFQVTSNSGLVTVDDVVSPTPISAFSAGVFGLLPAIKTERLVTQDPTVLDPYDDPISGPNDPDPATGTYFFLVDVPEGGGKLLDTKISESTSIDMDLFVGLDSNGDGLPSEDEEICSAATSAVLEHCTVTSPAAGTYWILVQNWTTGQAVDSVVVDTVIVSGMDEGNLVVTGPTSSPADTPFPVSLNWNEPAFEVGQTWAGLIELRSGTGGATDAGVLVVNFEVVSLDGEPTPTPTPGPIPTASPTPTASPSPSVTAGPGGSSGVRRGGASDWPLLTLLLLGTLSLRRRQTR